MFACGGINVVLMGRWMVLVQGDFSQLLDKELLLWLRKNPGDCERQQLKALCLTFTFM